MPYQRPSLTIWIQAVRAPFFTASIIPVALAAALARWRQTPVAWGLLPLTLLSAVLLHAGTNLINDYYDFRKGVDRPDTFGSSKILVNGILAPVQIRAASLVCFAAGFFFGLILVLFRGLPLLALGIAGVCAGYLYSGRPVGFKYRGLGDILVFLMMGPLLVGSAFIALTGSCSAGIFWAALPLGFMVTAILHANNTRDIRHDKEAGVVTWANRLGPRKARNWYLLLLAFAYASIIVLTLKGYLPALSLITFLSLPLALKNCRMMLRRESAQPDTLALIDVNTAQLHLVFGVLLISALVIA